jgi:hypothetical protein
MSTTVPGHCDGSIGESLPPPDTHVPRSPTTTPLHPVEQQQRLNWQLRNGGAWVFFCARSLTMRLIGEDPSATCDPWPTRATFDLCITSLSRAAIGRVAERGAGGCGVAVPAGAAEVVLPTAARRPRQPQATSETGAIGDCGSGGEP